MEVSVKEFASLLSSKLPTRDIDLRASDTAEYSYLRIHGRHIVALIVGDDIAGAVAEQEMIAFVCRPDVLALEHDLTKAGWVRQNLAHRGPGWARRRRGRRGRVGIRWGTTQKRCEQKDSEDVELLHDKGLIGRSPLTQERIERGMLALPIICGSDGWTGC